MELIVGNMPPFINFISTTTSIVIEIPRVVVIGGVYDITKYLADSLGNLKAWIPKAVDESEWEPLTRYHRRRNQQQDNHRAMTKLRSMRRVRL